jgi:hypothetical protein
VIISWKFNPTGYVVKTNVKLEELSEGWNHLYSRPEKAHP